jgi:dienelactone hydrolase
MHTFRLLAVCIVSTILVLFSAVAASMETLAIVGATVIDVSDFGTGSADISDAVVVIDGDLIVAVGPRSEVEIPSGARVLDARNRFIVPGLTDGFAALNNQAYADAYLECGVTSIIAVSGGRRGALAEDLNPSPIVNRLESVGDEPGTVEEHLAVLENLAADGVDIALMMYELTPEQLEALILRAHELGMGTIGELGRTTYAEGVIEDLDAVVHTTRYSLDTAPEAMGRAVAENPFSNDLESAKWLYYKWLSDLSPHDPRLAAHAEVLAAGNAALMPTFSLLHLDRPWAANPWKDSVARLLDPADIDAPADAATGRHSYDSAHQVAYSAVARAQFILEEAYHRAGARYLAGSGTDVWGTMPGISLHSELESLVRLGLTPRAAMAAATSNFATVFPNWGRRGEVRAGWAADVLVLTEDPRDDIRNLRSIEAVVLAGHVVERAGPRENGRDGTIIDRKALQAPPGAPVGITAEEITYLSDGLRVKGYLVRPADEKRYPCLVYARGGNRDFKPITPERVWDLLARMAGWGYVVAGSQYRGVAGGEGRDEFGGGEVNDLLNLIPVLEREPGADASRIGIYGGSRGGLMTYLTLARTDRFSAAVIRAGVSDLISWREDRPEMDEVFAEVIPGWETARESALLDRSPARWVDRMSRTTPILLLHGTADWRVSPRQSQLMATALLDNRLPFRLVLLEGSDHQLSEHPEEHARLTREWLDRFVRDGEKLPVLEPHGD